MALDPSDADKPLVYLTRLSAAERRTLLDVGRALPRASLVEQIERAEADVVPDRLILAEEMLKSAREMAAGGTERHFRAAVNRAYYALHHAARAMILRETHCEADGHAEAIKELKKLLADPAYRSRTGLTEATLLEVVEARCNRVVADYSPYEFSRHEGKANWVPITGNDWGQAANFNIGLAERILRAAEKAVGLA